MRWDIGIDLGTRNVRMLTEGAPGALAQAAALAVREGAEAPLCFGDAAMALYGRECAGVAETRRRGGGRAAAQGRAVGGR